MKYEIDSKAVRIFDDNGICFIEQPHHPEMRDWEGRAEMEAWAKNFIANFEKTPSAIIQDEKPAPTVIDLKA